MIETQALLTPAKPAPDGDAILEWLIALGDAADASPVKAVVSLGEIVEVAALACLATPPDLPPFTPAAPTAEEAQEWLITHGAASEEIHAAGGNALIRVSDVIGTVASMLAMQCPAWLETMIREHMP